MILNYTPVFLACLSLWVLSLVISPRKRPGLFKIFPYMALASGGAHLWMEGFYWYLFPVYGLTVLMSLGLILSRIRDPQGGSQGPWWSRVLSVSGALVLGVLAVGSTWAFPRQYPGYDGPWAPAYSRFTQGADQLGVYYPVIDYIAQAPGPVSTSPWENHLLSFKTGISLGGTVAPGDWSLLVLLGNPEEINRNQYLWAQLASWGFVCVFPEVDGEDSLDAEALAEAGRKIFTQLGLNYSGDRAVVSWEGNPGSSWSARIFWNPKVPPEGSSGKDLVLSTGPAPQGAYTALWTPATLPWNDDSLVRPWMLVSGQMPPNGDVVRTERMAVVKEFLLWKLRQGEGRFFTNPTPGSWSFRLVSP